MATYFFDTSALGKRYIAEIGSTWVKIIVDPAAQNTILISELLKIEMLSIFTRLRYHKQNSPITHTDFIQLRRAFLQHRQTEYDIIALDSGVLATTMRMIVKKYPHPLRTLDAIHLASAMRSQIYFSQLPKPIFVSADKHLLAAAQAEGFVTDDPNQHP